ncbi:MAG: AAA family ATPase [Saprospiraceae bacterium]|nr:AAA family ATPase [Saprospiraceae bacterium]
MINRNYPISSHYFPHLIENDAIYVDKTAFILPLLQKGNNATFFLSRPRRFGKSLFMSAIEHVFRGRQDLFKGLYIYDKIKWEEFPVIRLSLDRVGFTSKSLDIALLNEVKSIATSYQIDLNEETHESCFSELIQKLFKKYKKPVVILVDEYDKPIIYYIEKGNFEQAEVNRDILKAFYGILKDSGQFLRFTFITGVSKFSKVSIFSDLNYFDDLTLDPNFMTVCGFTEAEIKQYCGQGLIDLAEKEGISLDAVVEKMRFWYNGFSWNGKDFVYNPFSTMLLMKKQEFKNYWFETGTPSFLIPLINKDLKYDFSNTIVDSDIYNWHDLKRLDYLSIMLQTGYLTFKEHIVDNIYKIYYPNKEVENAFSKLVLEGYTDTQQGRLAVTILDIQQAFKRNDTEKVMAILTGMFKTLPVQFFSEDIEKKDKQGTVKIIKKAVNENFYHAIIYLVFNILGIKMPVEVSTNEGRIDAVVETDTHIYIFEFKKNRKPEVAIEQMKAKNYAAHYSLSKKQIVLVGVCFTMQKRGISGYLVDVL